MKRAIINLNFSQVLDTDNANLFANTTAPKNEREWQAHAIIQYVTGLAGIIPGFTDNAGAGICFDAYSWNPSGTEKTQPAERLAINYTIENLVLVESFGDYLLLQRETNPEITFMIKLKEGVTITRWRLAEVAHLG